MDKDLSKTIVEWENLLRQANELDENAIGLLGMPPTKITSEGLGDNDVRLSSLLAEFNAQAEILLVARLLNNHVMEESIWRSLRFIQYVAFKETGKKLETNILHVDEIAMSAVEVLREMREIPSPPTIVPTVPILASNEYILDVDGNKTKKKQEIKQRKFLVKKINNTGLRKKSGTETDCAEAMDGERGPKEYSGCLETDAMNRSDSINVNSNATLSNDDEDFQNIDTSPKEKRPSEEDVRDPLADAKIDVPLGCEEMNTERVVHQQQRHLGATEHSAAVEQVSLSGVNSINAASNDPSQTHKDTQCHAHHKVPDDDLVIVGTYKEGSKNKNRKCPIENCMFFGPHLDRHLKRHKEGISEDRIKLLIKRADVDEKKKRPTKVSLPVSYLWKCCTEKT